MGSVVVPDKFAVMALDPGGTTGLATGMFRTDRGDMMMKEVLARAIKKGVLLAADVDGDPVEQAWWLAKAWSDFRFVCTVERGIAESDVVLVIEDFQLRQRSADLAPVRVTTGLLTLLRGREGDWPLGAPVYQGPSEAKGTATNDRLRSWGLWQVGSEHRRDAMRHLATRVSRMLG